MKMNFFRCVLLVSLMLLLTSCSESTSEEDVAMARKSSSVAMDMEAATDRIAEQKLKNPNLAFEHHYGIEVDEGNLEERYQATLNLCGELSEFGCTIVSSSLSDRRYSSYANIVVRIKTAGVKQLVLEAAKNGELVSESISAEDLTDAIADIDKRMEMLINYRTKLEALENSAAQDVESLIKVAEELSKVQSQIETLSSHTQNLQQRIQLDVVTINLSEPYDGSFWGNIGDAFDEFGMNLSEGISSAITAVAYILPWTLTLILSFLGVKWLWKLLRRLRL